MTEKTSIAGTPLTPMVSDTEVKENSRNEGLGNTFFSEENSIDPDGKIRRGRTINQQNIPPDLIRSYIEIAGKYYFAGRPDSLAFEDRGRCLKTSLDNMQVTGSMVDVAKAKGWTEIRARGKETFRRAVWLHATARGIEVRGYMPRDEDLAQLKKLVRDREDDTPDHQTKDQKNESVNRLAGKLVEHGQAPYKHDKENRESYFVTLENSDGKESTTWGIDLERAVSESGANRGDQIELENHGRQPVTIDHVVKDDKGNVIRTEKINTHRNRWEVNAEALRNEKEDLAALAREKPDLVNEIAAIKMGEKVSRNFSSEADRQRFMEKVRERVADNHLQGHKPAAIKITLERPDREKEVENER